MVIKDISFVGFLKLNVFLILIPSLLNTVIFKTVRSANLQFGRILSQGSESLPRVESVPQNRQALSTPLDLALTMAPKLLMPFILVYFLAKVVHVLAQHTKIGEIKIGEPNA